MDHIEFLRQIAKKGGNTTKSRYSQEQRRKWGQKGGRPKKVVQ